MIIRFDTELEILCLPWRRINSLLIKLHNWVIKDFLKLPCSQHGPVFSQDVMQQATNAILRGGTIQAPTVSAKTIAEQLAEKINAKLNYVPIEKQEEEKQDGGQNESFKRYEEELEINDFPQASNNFAIIKCK